MSVDIQTVRRVARLARIAVTDEDAERMSGELNRILGFVEQLNEVDVSGVAPMTSVIPIEMKKREDVVSDGDKPDDIVANAPATAENFFSRVGRTTVIKAICEAKSVPAKRSWEKMKKAELAKLAEREVAGTGWLPAPVKA